MINPPVPLSKTLPDGLPLICTDRGQHKRTLIATICGMRIDPATGDPHPYLRGAGNTDPRAATPEAIHPVQHVYASSPDPAAEVGGAVSYSSFGFYCPRCKRWPKMKAEKFTALVVRLVLSETEIHELDLSKLPI